MAARFGIACAGGCVARVVLVAAVVFPNVDAVGARVLGVDAKLAKELAVEIPECACAWA